MNKLRPRKKIRSKNKVAVATPVIVTHSDKVGETVLMNVGRPDDLERLDVRVLHDNQHYRVNFIRRVGGRLTLKTSYYVVTDENGMVAHCTPPLDRVFWDDLLDNYITG